MAEVQCPNCPSKQCSLKGSRVAEHFRQLYRCRRCKKSFATEPVRPVREILEEIPPEHIVTFPSKSGDGIHRAAEVCGEFLC